MPRLVSFNSVERKLVIHAPSGEMVSFSARLNGGGMGSARGGVSANTEVTTWCRPLAAVEGYTSAEVSGWNAAAYLWYVSGCVERKLTGWAGRETPR